MQMDFRDTMKSIGVIGTFKVTSGKFDNTRSWSGIKGVSSLQEKFALQLSTNGEFMVGIGDKLYLLSSTLKQVAERKLSLGAVERNGLTYRDAWSIAKSP